MHDQEPVHLDIFESLFTEVLLRNYDVTLRSNGIHDFLTDHRITWPDVDFKTNVIDFIKTTYSPVDFFKNNSK